MKKLLAILLVIAVLSIPNVNAEPDIFEKPLVCDDVKIIFQTLKEDYKETPNWTGSTTTSKVVLFVNEQTKSWTLVEFNNTVACVLAAGEKSKRIIIPTT